jgi:hypothetical protein
MTLMMWQRLLRYFSHDVTRAGKIGSKARSVILDGAPLLTTEALRLLQKGCGSLQILDTRAIQE